jgi:hypothetical protein
MKKLSGISRGHRWFHIVDSEEYVMDNSRIRSEERGQGERVFVHTAGVDDVQSIVVSRDATLVDGLLAAGIRIDQGVMLLVGRHAFRPDPDVVDDEDEPVALDTPVDDLVRGGHVHVVAHSCRQIMVTVQYQNRSIDRRFSPARTVADVRAWAIRRLGLRDEAANDKLVLEICDSDRRPRPDVRIGTLTSRTCALCFDLVPEKIVEG